MWLSRRFERSDPHYLSGVVEVAILRPREPVDMQPADRSVLDHHNSRQRTQFATVRDLSDERRIAGIA
jgi:hypothetical protein